MRLLWQIVLMGKPRKARSSIGRRIDNAPIAFMALLSLAVCSAQGQEEFRLNAYARVLGGQLNGQSLSRGFNTVTADQSGRVRGVVEIEVYNSGQAAWVFPVVWCSTKQPHREFVVVTAHQPPGTRRYSVAVDAYAAGGYLIFAANWEMTGGNVVSLTNWSFSGGDRFDDGNDLQDLPESTLREAAAGSGRAIVKQLFDFGYREEYIPLTAIKVLPYNTKVDVAITSVDFDLMDHGNGKKTTP